MQYLLIHTGAPDIAGEWDDEAWAALASWIEETIASGVNIEGQPLGLDAAATTVKVRDGQLVVTDGPYAETKEQVAGFDVIECASLEEAVRWAGRHPHCWMGATEVRALAGGAPAAHLPEPSAGKARYMMLVCTDPAVAPEELARIEPVDPWVAEMDGRGVRLFGSELEPPGSARTVRVRESRAIVTDGPFAETKELIAGFWLWQVKSKEEAIEWLKRAPFDGGTEVEIRQVLEPEDFGTNLTPELREQEERLRQQSAAKKK
jgi:hypothetical protein